MLERGRKTQKRPSESECHCLPPCASRWLLYYPWELERAIAEGVDHYNHERYHESLDDVTPADVYEGRRNDILHQRAQVNARTMTHKPK